MNARRAALASRPASVSGSGPRPRLASPSRAARLAVSQLIYCFEVQAESWHVDSQETAQAVISKHRMLRVTSVLLPAGSGTLRRKRTGGRTRNIKSFEMTASERLVNSTWTYGKPSVMKMMMRNTPQILIVDSSKHKAAELKTHLKPLSYRVLVSHDGEEALSIIFNQSIDLVLLDIAISSLSGFEICRRIKRSPETQFIPVIITTELQNSDDKLKAIEFGADDFVSSPINDVELTTRLKSLIHLKSLHNNLDTSESILFSLAVALEAKDSFTKGHSERVAGIAVTIGKKIGLSSAELYILKRGGLLHDIGKIGIKEMILLKEGRLSDDEMDHIKTHPAKGHEICSPLKSLEPCLPIIRSHHERMDGKGYPDGLVQDKIPLLARITAVADSYDAMTHSRPYRNAMTKEKAVGIFSNEQECGQWDPEIVKTFLQIKEFRG